MSTKYRDDAISFWHGQTERIVDLDVALETFKSANAEVAYSSMQYRARMVEALVFELAHRMLADQGHCDGTGGAEYRRVRAEWYEAGCPTGVMRFIRERANAIPDAL